MQSVVMISCATAICYGIRGWWFPMWLMLIAAAIVAGAALFQETEK